MSIETYKRIENTTLDAKSLVIKSYEYIITNLEKMEEHGIEHPEYYMFRVKAINKWLDLYNCLDFTLGKEPAQNLGNLYGYCMNLSVKDNAGEHTHELIRLMKTVLEGWKGE